MALSLAAAAAALAATTGGPVAQPVHLTASAVAETLASLGHAAVALDAQEHAQVGRFGWQ